MARTLAQVDARLTTDILARAAADVALQSQVAALTARIAALDAPAPTPVPVPTPLPARQLVTVAAGSTGVLVPAGAMDVTIADKAFVGAQSAVKTSGEFAIRAVGTAANPIHRLTIRNCSMKSFGFGGVWLEFVQEWLLEDCEIDGIAYAGLMTISSTDGVVNRNSVKNIGLGYYGLWQPGMEVDPALNAYGMAFSAYGPGPQSERIKVTNNLVDYVPGWHGIDTHSGGAITIEDNIVRRTNRAYWASDAFGRPHDLVLNRNVAESPTPRPDVRNTPPWNEVAYSFINADRVSGSGNVATGWPQNLATDGSTAVTIAVG